MTEVEAREIITRYKALTDYLDRRGKDTGYGDLDGFDFKEVNLHNDWGVVTVVGSGYRDILEMPLAVAFPGNRGPGQS